MHSKTVRSLHQLLIILLLVVFSTGCTVGPEYRAPELNLPGEFGPVDGPADLVDLSQWWKSFGDPVLEKLILRAIDSNLDLQLASARIREARALLSGARSGFLPNIGTSAAYTRNSPSENARSGSRGATEPTSTSDDPHLFQAGFDAIWELDVFGGTRRRVEAAAGSVDASIESHRDTLVTLLAEVAQNYIELRGAQRELEITRRNYAAQEEVLGLQRMRYEAGLASELTVAQAEALLQSTAARIPQLEMPIAEATHRLSVLLGGAPRSLSSELAEGTRSIPRGPTVVAAGVPSELVRRRPDLRRSERLLAAATANIGVATADLFPKFRITGTAGLRSRDGGSLLENDSSYWSAGPSLAWAILSWPAVLANIEVQNARQEQALIAYRSAVLNALEEVENVLVAYDREQVRVATLTKSADANQRALGLARNLYEAGVADFLNVLNAEQALFQSETALVQSERQVASNLISLYKALGGGWSEFDMNQIPPAPDR